MVNFFLPALSLSAALAPLVSAYSNPGACSGACWAHDPAIIQRASDGQYYKFNTGGNIEIATASSISGPWTLQGYVMTDGSSIDLDGNTDLWAPDVHLVGDVYHLYYAVSTSTSQNSAIGLATSSSLDPGTWTDHGSAGVKSDDTKPYNAIDPNLIAVGSNYYLNFGSFWSDIYQVEMNSDADSTASGSSAHQISFTSVGTHAREGSYMFYYDGYYYLLWSQGICCDYEDSMPASGDEYKIMMCRSTSATGGFVDKDGEDCTENGGSTLLKSHGIVYGPGGQGVYDDTENGLTLYYHYADIDVGYSDGQYLFGWNVLSWSDGWPVV